MAIPTMQEPSQFLQGFNSEPHYTDAEINAFLELEDLVDRASTGYLDGPDEWPVDRPEPLGMNDLVWMADAAAEGGDVL